jgi:selenocysteine-specific elongation factor
LGVVLGTAGHIDHGKTALVKALTGVDTDRLREEKERGISIDLGFTHLSLPGVAADVGVVDVPGHERFVKNMLAGAGGIDLVLLVVASDEGVMPQTREHLDICLLLGIERAVVAMTKTDLADPELAEAALEDVRELLAGTPYKECPIVQVSSATGEGLDELRAALAGIVSDVAGRKPGGAFRMPVDRSFVMEGFGTVVTGTTWSGSVRVGDPIELLPSGIESRVRAIQVHGSETNEVGAGHRAAVALHGVQKSAAGRGDWAVAPNSFASSHMIDATLYLTKNASKPLKTRSRIRFHLGASEILGRVVLLESDELRPGDTGLCQFRLEKPAAAAKGDRFVIRTYSPARTIGGGRVLVPVATKHKKRDRSAIDSLGRQAAGAPEDDLIEVISRSGMSGVSLDKISREMGVEMGELTRLAEGQVKAGALSKLRGGALVTSTEFEKASGLLAQWIGEYQSSNPLRWGIAKGELKSKAKKAGIGPGVFEAVLEDLSAKNRLHARGERLRVDSPAPEFDKGTRAKLSEVESHYREAGVTPPTLKELSAGPAKAMGKAGLSEAAEYLAMEGRLVKITAEMFFHSDVMEKVVKKVAGYFESNGELGVPDFKGLVGCSRKFAVPLLEYLDRNGVTRRVGDKRAPGRALRKD